MVDARRVAAVLLAAAVIMLGTPASAQDDGDVHLGEIGPGWVPVVCPPAAVLGPGRTSRCFSSTAGDMLVISVDRMEPWYDPRAFPPVLANGLLGQGEPLPLEDLVDAAGRVGQNPFGDTFYVVVAASARYVTTIQLVSPNRSSPDLGRLAVDVARRQQERAGGPPPPASPSSREADAELDALLFTPRASTGLTVVSTTSLRQRSASLADDADPRLVQLLDRTPVRLRVMQGTSGELLGVMLSRQPYELFAAAALGAAGRSARMQRVAFPGLDQIPDAVGYRSLDAAAPFVAVSFRKGRYQADVFVQASLPATPGDLARVAVAMAVEQAALLPDGPTDAYEFPPLGVALALALGLSTLAALALLGVTRARAALARRGAPLAGRVGPPTPGEVVDVGALAARVRRRGWRVVAVQVLALDLIVVGVFAVFGWLSPLGWYGLILIALGLLAGWGLTALLARHELGRRADGAGPRRARSLSVGGVVGAAVAVLLLVVGLAVAATGVAGIAFGPSLTDLERADSTGLPPQRLLLALALIGLALLALGAATVRFARKRTRSSASRLLARDRRRPVLYLRPFDDDALLLPTVVSARRPFLELTFPHVWEPFEDSIAWELASYGPVVAVGRPGRPLASLGAARDHLPEDEWREHVRERMAEARAVVVVPGTSQGVRWEIEHLVTGGFLSKVVVVLPPLEPAELEARWRALASVLAASGVLVPPLPAPVGQVLVAVLHQPAGWRVASGDWRDEATYRAAIDVAMTWIDDGTTVPAMSPTSVMSAAPRS